MRIAIFGGSFDPVHKEHVRFVKAAIGSLRLDKVLIVPAYSAPHKLQGSDVSAEHRLKLCAIAFKRVKKAAVSDFEIRMQGTSYSYLTCRHFADEYPEAERFLLLGADMLENFYTWKKPADILQHATLAVCGRGEALDEGTHERFRESFHTDFVEVPFVGKDVSSTAVRVQLAFGLRPKEICGGVWRYIKKNGLYRLPAIPAALELEKPKRRAHSLRVAQMACARARGLGIPEQKAMLAAAVHDCGKYVPLGSDLLAGFDIPHGVPRPVMHQYTGAYIAEHLLGITDEGVLDAVRYHTSGRRGMSDLEKLIYLSDLLENGRDFAGVEKLREIFWQDLDACLLNSLALQIDYLRSKGAPVYPLTEEAYAWIKGEKHTDL